MRNLRHDFRRCYGCSFDEVPPDECADLMDTLPDGSLYVASHDLARSWSEQRHLAADIRDTILECVFAMRGIEDAPYVVRPKHMVAQAKAAKQAARARAAMEQTEWEEASEPNETTE